MKGNKQSITGYREIEVPFTLIQHEKASNPLAIFLPGEGYTSSRPVFHYSKDVFVNHDIDVLEVDYQYKEAIYDDFSMEEICEAVQTDVEKVLNHVLTDTSYDQYYLVAKSLGTIGLSAVINRPEFKNANIIWLTPLLLRDEVLETMINSTHRSLSIIGTNDRNYETTRYEKMIRNSNINSKVIPNLNHSMMYEADTLGSIEVLKSIIEEIERFVKITMVRDE